MVDVDLIGGPPGSCAIDLVRDRTSPLWTLVLVFESLHVPPVWARAFDIPWRLLAPPPILVFDVLRSQPAALPALPIVDDVPCGAVEVAPRPNVDADVPPAAALPPVPPVAELPALPTELPPEPMVEAL